MLALYYVLFVVVVVIKIMQISYRIFLDIS